MAEPKAKTIIERHGFKDPELRTKTHDELCADTAGNLGTIVRSLFPQLYAPWDKEITGPLLEKDKKFIMDAVAEEEVRKRLGYRDWTPERLNRLRSIPFPTVAPINPGPDIEEAKWEQPITDGKWVIGFVDFTTQIHVPSLKLLWGEYEVVEERSFTLKIEVKVKIDSFGELMRQINMYRVYDRGETEWMIVSPDAQYRELLKTQGIHFAKVC